MMPPRILIAGAGAAGVFAAARCATLAPGVRVVILERGASPLAKVRVSGGGRCNLTHALFEPRDFARHYPRGAREMIGPLSRFGPRETVGWFAARGVGVQAEPDGRMFPSAGTSSVVVDALLGAAAAAGVEIRTRCGLAAVKARPGGGFDVRPDEGGTLAADRLLLATGGCTAAMAGVVESLGHTVEAPVPSLFALRVEAPWLRGLAGVSVEDAEIAAPGLGLRPERGGILITHRGLSGPAVLRLSAWSARLLAERACRTALLVNWLPGMSTAELDARLQESRRLAPARRVASTPIPPLPARLWEGLALSAGLAPDTRWAGLTRPQRSRLAGALSGSAFECSDREREKGEFVTCGGVRLREVDFRTSESRVRPGLYFAGELLDVDGLTGGFNLQAAWTTGWVAGTAMAAGVDRGT